MSFNRDPQGSFLGGRKLGIVAIKEVKYGKYVRDKSKELMLAGVRGRIRSKIIVGLKA